MSGSQTQIENTDIDANVNSQQNLSIGQSQSSGVASLDLLFAGNMPSPSNIVLLGAPLCGKKILSMQYIYEGLRSEIPGIFVLTDFGYTDWKAKMHGMKMDITPFEQSGLLHIVDAYSKQYEPSLQDAGAVSYIANLSALSSLSIKLAEIQDKIAQTGRPHRLVFHSVSTLLQEIPSKAFYKFLQFEVGKFRSKGASSFFCMEKGMHSSEDEGMVAHLMDGILEFENSKIRLRGFGSKEQWHDYSISENGIEIK